MRNRAARAALLLTFGYGVTSFCYGQAGSSTQRSESLVVVSGAMDPKYLAQPDGREQLAYTCAVEYPAQEIVASISRELRKRHWKPLKEDFLNPGLPSSLVSGWTSFQDSTTHPTEYVHQWMADWENPAHDVVRYDLEYRSPDDSTRDLRSLQVIALYIPARIVIEMKRATSPRP